MSADRIAKIESYVAAGGGRCDGCACWPHLTDLLAEVHRLRQVEVMHSSTAVRGYVQVDPTGAVRGQLGGYGDGGDEVIPWSALDLVEDLGGTTAALVRVGADGRIGS